MTTESRSASEIPVAANLAALRHRIAIAARAAGRDPTSVRLVAVSKTFSAAHVRLARAAGQVDFGENRVQEALPKIAETADPTIAWHLVGHLQSNKARKAASAFSWIHSIDSTELVRKLETAALDAGTAPQLLIQVDLAREPTKTGASPDEVSRILEAATKCRAVRLRGLMTMPPFTEDPEGARPFFRQLRELATRLRGSGVDANMLGELSMGMSHDFEVAVEEGATMVRVGTAVFGHRMKARPHESGADPRR